MKASSTLPRPRQRLPLVLLLAMMIATSAGWAVCLHLSSKITRTMATVTSMEDTAAHLSTTMKDLGDATEDPLVREMAAEVAARTAVRQQELGKARETGEAAQRSGRWALLSLVGPTVLTAAVAIWYASGVLARQRRRMLASQVHGEGPLPASDRTGCWQVSVTVGLMNSAVHALDDPDDRNRYAEEWASDRAEIAPGWPQLRWALILRLWAAPGIQRARRGLPSASPPSR